MRTTRRNFLKGLGLGAAGAAVAGKVAAAPNVPATVVPNPKDKIHFGPNTPRLSEPGTVNAAARLHMVEISAYQEAINRTFNKRLNASLKNMRREHETIFGTFTTVGLDR